MKWSAKCEVRSVWSVVLECEMWSMGCEVWSVECEVWTVEGELWSGECGV